MLGELINIVTGDGVDLQGVLFNPSTRSGHSAELSRSPRSGQTPTAVGVWIHGLTSNFYRGMTRLTTLAGEFNRAGLALASINTRGHDMVAGGTKKDVRKKKGYKSFTVGSAYEKFQDSFDDLDGMVDFLKKRFTRIFLLGHSTGANKVVYYLSRKNIPPKVAGAALISPVSDVSMMKTDLGEKFREVLNIAQKMVKEGRKDELIPQILPALYSAQRLISLADQESIEQMFPTREFSGPLTLFSKVKISTLVVFGENDDYLKIDQMTARRVFEIFKKFSRSVSFSTLAIKGADHSFTGHEQELAEELVKWIKKEI